MKVIDLLNKIANGEEIPKKIKLDSIMFIFQDGEYISNNGDGSCLDEFMCFYYRDLNKEVEIIEEDNKIRKIYTFPGLEDDDYAYEDGNRPNNVKINNKMEGLLIDKINEIIDKLNEGE